MSAFKFIKREIDKKSIGSKLRKARQKKRLSLAKAEEKTKIRTKYLRYLEEEDFKSFPCPVYIPGFIQSYAKFLKISDGPLVSLYTRGVKVEEKINSSQIKERKELKLPKFFLTPTVLIISLVILIFLGVLGYITYQVSGFARAPYLIVKSPADGSVVNKDLLPIEGKISPSASLYINGQILSSDSEGNFKQEVKLKEGKNSIYLAAQNRSGKKTEKELLIILKEEGG